MMLSAKSKRNIVLLAAAVLLIIAVLLALTVGARTQRIRQELELGMRYLEELDYISARFAFEGVLKIDDKNVDAYLGLAEIEYQLGVPEEALAIVERALTLTADARLEERRSFYADAIPSPEDVIELENKDLEVLLLHTLGKPDGVLLQEDLDRVSGIACMGYRFPQIAVTFDDGTSTDMLMGSGYDAAGQFTADYNAVVSPIELMFDLSIVRFAELCRNAEFSIDMLSLDADMLRILPRIRGLRNLTVWEDIDLSLMHNLRYLESLTFFFPGITDFTPLFREGALPALVSLNVIDEGTLSEETGEPVLNTFDFSGISVLTSLQNITVESTAGIIGLTDIAALPNLTSLYLKTTSMDLTQLSGASHLTSLRIDGLDEIVLDTSAMSSMTALEYFYFYGCTLTDPTQLAPLTALKKLDLSDMGLTDISFLSGMTQMEYLNLNDNAITDITALRNMEKLIHLEMNNNRITDVTPLSGKPVLEDLRMENNQITALKDIDGLTSLRYLLMYGNPVVSIDAVADMPALSDLRVDDAMITDWSPAAHVQYINTNNDYWGGSPWH